METNAIHKPMCNVKFQAYVTLDKDEKRFIINIYNGDEETKLILPQQLFMQIMDELKLKPFREQRKGLTSTIIYFYNPTT